MYTNQAFATKIINSNFFKIFKNFYFFFKKENNLFFFFIFCHFTKSSHRWDLKELIKLIFFIFFWIKVRVLYYLNNWVYTTNHKRIAVNYFWFVILSGIVGMVLATVIRLEFAYPGVGIFAGDSLQYLSLVTAHGVIMVFFMIMPLLLGAFANFLLPTQLGVHDVAFPRLNSAAFWFLPGGLLMLAQLVCVDRRYQRMNCFNIREIQSLLKKRFYVDLINNHDHRNLLHKTVLNLKYKTNDSNIADPNLFVFYNYGIDITPKKRLFSFNYFNTNSDNYLNQNSYFFLIIEKFKSYNFFSIINNFYFSFFSFFNNYFDVVTIFKNVLFFLFSFFNIIFLFIENNFSVNFDKIFNLFTFNFTFDSLFFYLKFWLINFLYNFLFFYNFLFLLYKNFLLSFSQTLTHLFTNWTQFRFFEFFYFNFKNFKLNLLEFFFFYNIFEFFYFLINFYNNFILIIKNIFIKFSFFFKYITNFNYLYVNNVTYTNFFQDYNNKNFYLNNAFNVKISENSTDLSNLKTFYSSYNFNTHLIYFYLIFHFITQIPYLLFWFFYNIFNFKEMSLLVNNFNNLLTTWYVPLLINDNIFYSFWHFVYNFIFFFNHFNYNNVIVSFYNLVYFFFLNLQINFFNLIFFFKFYNIFNILFFNTFFFFHNFINICEQIILTILFNNKTFFIFDIFYKFLINKSFYITEQKNNYNYENVNLKNFSNNDNTFQMLTYGEEIFSNYRYQRFDNPIFKYDYKSGDYYPKLYKEMYPYMFPSFIELTGGLRTSPWFLSLIYTEVFSSNFANYIDNFNNNNKIHSYTSSKFFHTDSFYNFFFILNNSSTLLNKRWVSFNVLDQKFYKFFHTSSMQQRIYSNWRNLKFTREAWRCKLLMARHQKTLFRRYIHEDGVFWSIERNAKDLLPGWAMITPFSSRTRFTAIGKTDIGLMGVLLVLNSSIISAANFLVTYRYLSTLNNRKMRDARSFFTEAIMVSSWMMIAANPMLVIGIIMLLSDRHWQTSFFDYSGGGDTVLFQHMFWFFGHPEVYIIILPTFGFTNTMISYYLKKRVSARASLLYSMYTIAFLGFFVWGHHMYMVGLAHTTRMLFSTLTVMISVPAATKLMHWCVTTVNSSFAMELPLVCTLTFIFLFVSGGISGMCVAHTGMDVLFHDTFYVIGHFHVMLAGAAMIASFGAFYFYFVAIFGVKYSRIYAYLHFTYYLLGQLFTVIPMFWLGYAGMPRRVLDYPASFGGWHSVISGGHMLSVAGLIAFFIMIFDSLRQAKAATRNTFGIARYNTRLNFYIYEIAKLNNVQEKAWALFRFLHLYSIKLNKLNFYNFEPYETTLMSYTFSKKSLKK